MLKSYLTLVDRWLCHTRLLSNSNDYATTTHHGEEDAKLQVEGDIISISEDKTLLTLLLTLQYNGNLLRGHRQHGQLNSVELVKTTP